MSNITEIISIEEFEKELEGDMPVLVDFYATWCGPCKMQSPILHEFAEEMGDKVKVVKIDVDQNEKLAYKYSIMTIPTIAVFKNGEMKEKNVGLTSKAGLSDLVIKYL